MKVNLKKENITKISGCLENIKKTGKIFMLSIENK